MSEKEQTDSSKSHSPARSVDILDGGPVNEAPRDDGPPDGGLRAWLVVAGGFLTYFVTFGLLNTFGTFQAYYSAEFLHGMSESAISWIGTIQLFLLFIGGLVFGPMFDAKGSLILFVPGTFIYVFSIMMTSLCTKYYQLILAQGILFGIGDAMLFYPTISSLPHWFDRRRGIAAGIVVAGSSLGGIAWPLILDRLFKQVGFPWALRITGFICLIILVPCCAMVVPRKAPGPKEEIPPSEFKAMFKDAGFMLLVAGMFLVMWGMFIPFYYMPAYGLAHGMSLHMGNALIATLNAGSLVGRIVSGLAADKFGRFNVAFVCALLSGIILFCLHAIRSPASIIAFSVLYGAFSGGLISLQSACVAQITTNVGMIGVKIGVLMALSSFGVLTGSPIGGALIARSHGGWGGFIDFCAVILLAGAALLLASRLAVNKNPWKAV